MDNPITKLSNYSNKPPINKWEFIIGIIFFAAVVVCIFWGLSFQNQEAPFLAKAQKTTGILTSVEQDAVMRPPANSYEKNATEVRAGTNFNPVITFTTQDGQSITFTAIGASKLLTKPVEKGGSYVPDSPFTIGQKFNILYDPQNPQNAQVEGQLSFKGSAVAMYIWGGIFLLCSLIFLFISSWNYIIFYVKRIVQP